MPPRPLPHAAPALLLLLTACGEPTAPDASPPVVGFDRPTLLGSIWREVDTVAVTAGDDRGVARVDVLVSGQRVATMGRERRAAWRTTPFPDGDYVMTALAHDAAGNLGTDSVRIRLTSLLVVRSVQVNGVTDADAAGRLEAEVHLYDAVTHAFLGCAGQATGLEDVDAAGVRYEVWAFFKSAQGGEEPLTFQEVAGRPLRLVVTEDDALPCPSSHEQSPWFDDVIGSTTLTLLPGDTERRLAFGQVAHLELRRARMP